MSRIRLKSMVYALAVGSCVAVGVRTAESCLVCVTFPQRSAADHLIESPCVVFAREDPARPFSYAVIESLKGTADDKPIDLLVNRDTRRRLAADPKQVAVLAYDDEQQFWRPLGIADTTYAAVVRRVLLLSPQWQGERGQRRRVEFFLPLFGHDNPVLRDLAYLEMAKAPYSTIKQLGRNVSRDDIDRVIHDPRLIQWRPLTLLMLAQSGAPADHEFISKSFHSAARYSSTTNLAALTTAYIEIESTDALSFVDREYLQNRDRTTEELRQIHRALSLHGTEGRRELRDQIVSGYADILRNHPQLAPQVAADLVSWQRTELVERLTQIESSDAALNYAERKTIRQYLRSASTPFKSARIDD